MKICSLLFLLRDDEILLAMKKRGFGVGRYNGVGGKAEVGESSEQTAIRECQEEITVIPRQLQKVAIHHFEFEDGTPGNEVHTYLSRDWKGQPTETEEMAPHWFKLCDIPYSEMWDDDIFWLPAILQGQKLVTYISSDADQHMTHAKLRRVDSLR